MQIWAEPLARAYVGDRGASNLFTQKVVDQDPLDKGMWTDMDQLKGTRPLSHALPCDSAESSGVRNRANVDGLSMLDPKVILGLTPKVTEASKAPFIKDAHAQHMTSLKGLEDIKVLAENFILAMKNWEVSSKATHERREEGPSVEETSHTHAQLKNNDSHRQTQGESTNTAANQAESREAELQIQQIHQPEPVDMLNPIEPEVIETEASNWVNSHILELSNTYGVAFEGFESETLELLMRIDERKMEIDKTKQPKETTTPKSRGRGKNELKNLQSSLNKEVEGETKVNKGVERVAFQLWPSRWMRCGFMVADGSKGGILLMWDNRVWKGSKVEEGNFSITYKFEALQDSFCWTFTGVYAPHTRKEKLECWEEMAAMKGPSEGPWVTGGDFNTVRHMLERRGCSRITNIMADFSKWIEDLELHDPILIGGKYTWVRGLNHQSNTRLDRFLYSTEWEESFKNIRQRIMPRVTSDHNPILLECGDWEKRNSYFKFENWWLKVEGFNELVQEWWNGFTVVGCPDYKLCTKLKLLKQKLKDWSRNTFSEMTNRKNNLLEELVVLDRAQEDRELSEEELMVRATILVELEVLANHDEER
ncbi:hypothetical protein MTR67_043934 [Solanum verrucosum]|uniref:Uncharacterized protein n=1 Tax=Solanum verrucosum TaxID=315347 RepID=A0AAF0USJ8_SOLVR|nr:hypothetical protein MTR67_043934 [Solanum verrucosum]